jgi:hypothetical protein
VTALATMQKGNLDEIAPDVHGRISKQSVELHGVAVTRGSEAEFVADDVMLLPPGHDAWTVGDEACVFVEFSHGNDYYAGA